MLLYKQIRETFNILFNNQKTIIMKNFEDSREDLLDDIQEVLTRFSGSERQTLAKQIIHDAAFLGTKTQTPKDSIEEAISLIHATVVEFYGDFKTRGEFEQFYLSWVERKIDLNVISLGVIQGFFYGSFSL